MKMYITKKDISKFIENERRRLNLTNDELLIEVDRVLIDLKQFPESNKNQIKFYTKVLKTLKNEITL
jgi:hypothetical protein